MASSAASPPSAFPKPSRRNVPATVLSAVLLAQSISGGGAGDAAGAAASTPPGDAAGDALSGLFGKMGVSVPEFVGEPATYWKWLHEDVFSAFDANGDGHFDESEIGAHGLGQLDADKDGLVSMGEMTLSKALILFASLDADG